jgi:hypothetical protein
LPGDACVSSFLPSPFAGSDEAAIGREEAGDLDDTVQSGNLATIGVARSAGLPPG